MRSVPKHRKCEFSKKNSDYCVFVFVINEGQRLLSQLELMSKYGDLVDIVIADGGSSDGSTAMEKLIEKNVNALLVNESEGRLGSQMRMAFSWALDRGYKGIIVIDGNGKDGVDTIPSFVEHLQCGFDHIQGSRFIDGGYHENTPRSRLLGVKLLHAPLISLASGFKYTDTTNGYRGYSATLLDDPKISIFRDFFTGYELHYYLAVEAPRNGYQCVEIPVSRVYPSRGPVPTKIKPFTGSVNVLLKLFSVVLGRYRP